MFNQYEPNVKATIAFLKLLDVKVNSATVDETLQNHPDWPGLLCVSDSFNKWNIPNGAGKIEPNQIGHLPVPFIAYTHDREHPLCIVTKVTDTTIDVYSKNYNKAITKSKEEFLKSWTGIYLIAEPDENSGEKEYEKNKRKAFINALIPASLFALLLIISFFSIYNILNNNVSNQVANVTGVYFQYFILLAGVVVTSLLLWYEIDKTNPLLQKVCTGITKGNCNAILTGKQSKLFSWLSWSEVGFFYFSGGLLALLFASSDVTNTISLLGWLNILALPYTVFSVYYQWRVAKQWCVLCLAVQALLVLGGINIIANNYLLSFSALSFSFFTKNVLLYLLPILLWYVVKPYILHLQKAKNTKREYLRIKFNTEIFETLLKKQKHISVSTEGLGIDIGNPRANNTLIKVCNPYCGPCAKAHPKIDKLLEEVPNLKVKIIFTTPNLPEQRAYKPVSHLLAINEQSNNEGNIKRALDNWYLTDKKDYERFAIKYPMNGLLAKQGYKIEAMEKWCNAMKISATPTIFINGYQLPDAYGIEDLQYFLLE
jgi:thiol-disulfide isomerase/thioredoxin